MTDSATRRRFGNGEVKVSGFHGSRINMATGDDDIHREVTEVGGGGDDRAGAGEQ